MLKLLMCTAKHGRSNMIDCAFYLIVACCWLSYYWLSSKDTKPVADFDLFGPGGQQADWLHAIMELLQHESPAVCQPGIQLLHWQRASHLEYLELGDACPNMMSLPITMHATDSHHGHPMKSIAGSILLAGQQSAFWTSCLHAESGGPQHVI